MRGGHASAMLPCGCAIGWAAAHAKCACQTAIGAPVGAGTTSSPDRQTDRQDFATVQKKHAPLCVRDAVKGAPAALV
jgi:hypothetical protein